MERLDHLDRLVAVLGTLDTKGPEVAFLAGALRDRGLEACVVDLGLLGEPAIPADVPRDEVAAAADEPAALGDAATDRERAMAVMARGAGVILRRLDADGRLAGVVGVGGSKGTWMATAAMRELPWGVPKVMVASTVAGDLRRYTGHRDIVFMPTVVDLSGLNTMTRHVLARGAAALAGLISAGPVDGAADGQVAIMMAGVVTPLGQAVQRCLEGRGLEPVVFPANGAGGLALEEAIEGGQFVGVVDLALLELSNELIGGICSAGPGRLEAAGRAGLPQVVVPGAVEFANFAGPDNVPERFQSRQLVDHTPAITLVRLSESESRELGGRIADKLNHARGPVELLIPTAGFSAYDQEGQPFHAPASDEAFVDGLRSGLDGATAVQELDLHINDPAFAEAVAAAVGRVISPVVALPQAHGSRRPGGTALGADEGSSTWP